MNSRPTCCRHWSDWRLISCATSSGTSTRTHAELSWGANPGPVNSAPWNRGDSGEPGPEKVGVSGELGLGEPGECGKRGLGKPGESGEPRPDKPGASGDRALV